MLDVGINGHLLADFQNILVESERLLGGNEDFFITLPLIPVLSWVVMSGLADNNMRLDNRLLALAFARASPTYSRQGSTGH